ncbi:MAG: hypothetical protein KC438_13275 [Thermomicrobiales bacterium]|nr:hypothetical protein [Thermomicrobiales bacterium]
MATAPIRITMPINNFNRIASRFEPAVQAGLVKAAADTMRISNPLTPFRTGHLRNSAQMRVERLRTRVFWMALYAAYQEFGTRRGIRPKEYARRSHEQAGRGLTAYLSALEAKL